MKSTPAMEALKARYRDRLAETLPLLSAWVEAGAAANDADASFHIHNMAGGASLFGFGAVGLAAKRLDEAIHSGQAAPDEAAALLQALQDALKE